MSLYSPSFDHPLLYRLSTHLVFSESRVHPIECKPLFKAAAEPAGVDLSYVDARVRLEIAFKDY